MTDSDEGVLDPWVTAWLDENATMMEPPHEYTADYLEAARPRDCPFPTRESAKVTDEVISGVPVRIYEHDHAPSGVLVYLHGGGFCVGSIGLMENIAKELAFHADAAVISVGYRLAPEHPYPAGFEDAAAITRWTLDHAGEFGVESGQIVLGGESAGGNLTATVALRLREDRGAALAGQLLMYPVLDVASDNYPSRLELDSPMLRSTELPKIWSMYAGGRDMEDDEFVAPLKAKSLRGLPPAFILLGGADPLRDEGRHYSERLRQDSVPVEELCLKGQPHGFLNLGFPASEPAYLEMGAWLRRCFSYGAAAGGNHGKT
jgi:acetyl esterase